MPEKGEASQGHLANKLDLAPNIPPSPSPLPSASFPPNETPCSTPKCDPHPLGPSRLRASEEPILRQVQGPRKGHREGRGGAEGGFRASRSDPARRVSPEGAG